MAQKFIMTNGTATKSINPWTDETPGVWSPDPANIRNQAKSTRLVPSVFAGIHARMQAMMDLPFSIYNLDGDEPVDTSDNYKNIVGFLPNPARVMGLTEAALATSGRAYWYKGTGATTGKIKLLKYWMPDSVTLDQDKARKGEIEFKRIGENTRTFSDKEILHFWLYDEAVEVGPPTIWPLLSATIAAEAGGAIMGWVRDYMRRGAIKAMLLAVDGAPPAGEVERIERWWNRFMSGIVRGWKVFNMQTISPTIVGDGLEALKDLSITKELRYEVHQALGTRHLLEDENYATAQARERQFYTITVMPDARLIQAILNEQILTPLGYQLVFEPERLEIFQEDEAARAESLSKLFDVFAAALGAAQALTLSMGLLGYDLSKEQQKVIDEGLAAKEKEKAEQQKLEQEAMEAQAEEKKPPTPPNKALIELDKWQKKVTAAGKMVTWHAVDLPAEMAKAITDGIVSFEDARAQIQGTVTQTQVPSYKSEIMELAKALNNATEKGFFKTETPAQPNVNITMSPISLTTTMPEAGAPSVTFSPVIQPSEVVNQNNISVEPTPVSVTNEVNPTPVTVENNTTIQPAKVTMPKEKKKDVKLKIERDREGRISSAKGEIE